MFTKDYWDINLWIEALLLPSPLPLLSKCYKNATVFILFLICLGFFSLCGPHGAAFYFFWGEGGEAGQHIVKLV